ncbi:hypothetical protein K1719_038542 [Acacia pycnantha]|nr:hypothetical protein K1719_038542 [Acacia pycnantha]
MRDPAGVGSVVRYLDEDGDGKVSAEELWRHRLGKMGGEIPLEEAEAAIKALDSDGDGLLSLEDLEGLTERVGEEDKLEDLREAFKIFEEFRIMMT